MNVNYKNYHSVSLIHIIYVLITYLTPHTYFFKEVIDHFFKNYVSWESCNIFYLIYIILLYFGTLNVKLFSVDYLKCSNFLKVGFINLNNIQ